ncbi:hypothetical protein, conserved [Eimeria necatrix]|uniref:Conserved oligomeric Golgi complex subunit 8 n=1 Tax=Eimeria necatrix TaxID=51315 RepID=U6MSQ0_9EIME|nr:hypothetical protein, conserved [Eimeria necatrix]CDJ67021.1 hypothetical protein, conserved [Eimeria necatrix]
MLEAPTPPLSQGPLSHHVPISQQFLHLLLGDDAAAALTLGEDVNAKSIDKPTPSNGLTRPNLTDELQDESRQFQASYEATLPTGGAEGNTIKVPGIDEILQMTGDELCRQPALLHIEAEKLVDAQDKLAVQNCSLFLASSKALSSLSRSISSLSATLGEMEQCIQPLQNGLKQFRAESNAAASHEASLHILISLQPSVSGLLELPSLVLNCSNGGLYDEAVDALMLADERIASLRANGCCGMRLLDSLEVQMKEARNTCMKAMLRQLGQHAQLAASIKLIGPLRRLSCSEEQLTTQFLHRRDGEISRQRHNAEVTCETDPAHGLCAAAELLRVDILQTAVHYRAIFGKTDGRLSTWLAEQVHWFVKLLNQELLKSSSKNVAVESFESGRSSIDIAAVEALANQTSVQPPSNFRLGLLDLATVFRQTYNAATAFRRVQCYFFPVVAFTFDRYVVAVHRQTIECIAAAFARSMNEYDFTPSMLHFSLLESSPWFQSCLSVIPGCVFLLRHGPVSNLYNSIAEVLNAFQECPISTTAPRVVILIESLLVFCIRKLTSMKPGNRDDFEGEINAIENSLLQKKDVSGDANTRRPEFFVLCDIFASILISTVARQLALTIACHTGLDTEKLRALMTEAGLCRSPNPLTAALTAPDTNASAPNTPSLAPCQPLEATLNHHVS